MCALPQSRDGLIGEAAESFLRYAKEGSAAGKDEVGGGKHLSMTMTKLEQVRRHLKVIDTKACSSSEYVAQARQRYNLYLYN